MIKHLSLLFICCSSLLFALPQLKIDRTFGTNGFAIAETEVQGLCDNNVVTIKFDPLRKHYYVGSPVRGDTWSGFGRVSRLDIQGKKDLSFGTNGHFEFQMGDFGESIDYKYHSRVKDIFIKDSGNLIAAGHVGASPLFIGLDSRGKIDKDFGVQGVILLDPYAMWGEMMFGLHLLKNGNFFAGHEMNGNFTRFHHFTQEGKFVASGGPENSMDIKNYYTNSACEQLLPDGHGGYFFIRTHRDDYPVLITRFNDLGQVDKNWNQGKTLSYKDNTFKMNYSCAASVLATRTDNFMVVLNYGKSVDPALNYYTAILTLSASGKILGQPIIHPSLYTATASIYPNETGLWFIGKHLGKTILSRFDETGSVDVETGYIPFDMESPDDNTIKPQQIIRTSSSSFTFLTQGRAGHFLSHWKLVKE